MYILSIESSSNSVSTAILQDDHVLAYEMQHMERGQAESLIPLIEKNIRETRLCMSELDAIAVAVGPGSFTGVRIALSAARALGLALDIPVWGVSNFEVAIFGIHQDVTVVLDTKRGDYYVQKFDAMGKQIGNPGIKTSDQLAKDLPFIAVGDGAEKLKSEIGCDVVEKMSPPAICVGKIAFLRSKEPMAAEPIYLRDAETTC